MESGDGLSQGDSKGLSTAPDLPGRGAGAYHVLRVQRNGPGAQAGLEAFFDFILSINGIRLAKDNPAQLERILEKSGEADVDFVVYSSKSRRFRTLPVRPSRTWGGPGSLGLSIRFCSFLSPPHGEDVPRTLYVDLDGVDKHPQLDLSISVSTNSIGLQINFDDPDIYYFAGGRHVALQTEGGSEEFPPLDLLLPSTTPVLVVQCRGEGDLTSQQFPDAQANFPATGTARSDATIVTVERGTKTKVLRPPNNGPVLKRHSAKCGAILCPVVRSSIPPPTKVQVKKISAKKREIGEDGWETVRGRYSRSKWSLSSRSSSSSNNDIAGFGAEGGSRQEDSGEKAWKEAEAENVAAEEEQIQEKEAALDSAIREEELIEHELSLIEKDFHQIEKGSSHLGERKVSVRTKATATDLLPCATAPSPEALEASDLEIDLGADEVNKEHEGVEDCFFIDMTHAGQKLPEDLVGKDTERIVALREKLMSPAKCRDSAETLRRHHAKLAKAEMNRERLLEAKYNRYVELSERFQTLNETTRRLVEERSELIAKAEERRSRAVQKRHQLLEDIKKKAHDEESKAKEIAFINLLETQIKRSGFLSSAHAKELEVGGRLQSREEERKLKLEDRFQKLSAVLDRQSKIKRDWESKLAQIQEKRRRASERILREKQKRAKERSELAQEKARGREERLCALNALKDAKKEELKKMIEQKQEDTARRHEENMEHIRQKAIELTVPRTSEDTPTRVCTLCKVVIESEVQELAHLRGRAHLDAVKRVEKGSGAVGSVCGGSGSVSVHNFGIHFIADVQGDKVEPGLVPDKNRLKVLRKHCAKLVQKLRVSGKEFERSESPVVGSGKEWSDQGTNKSRIHKNIREMDRLIGLFNAQRGTLPLANTLDRLLADTRRASVRCSFIQDSLIGMGLFPVLEKIFDSKAPDLPQRVMVGACNLLVGATFRNVYNSVYVLRSSVICSILELSSRRWESFIPDGHRWLCGSPSGQNEPLPLDPVIAALVESLSTLLSVIPDPFDGVRSGKQRFLTEGALASLHGRNLDIIAYIVGSGIVDRLAIYCGGVRGPLENQQVLANLLKEAIDFLTMLVYSLQASWDPKKPERTQLLAALESSEMAGAISMSYSLLLHQGAPSRPRVPSTLDPTPPAPEPLSASLLKSTLSLINAFAKVDLIGLQRLLGSEAISLQFRHIASQLLWQVVPHSQTEPSAARLVHELLMALANFTLGNTVNQMRIQGGQTPTVLQQLCTLPSAYFTDQKLSRFLLPTLIAATFGCPDGEAILSRHNISMETLHQFLQSDVGKVNPVCRRIIIASALSPSSKSA